MTKDKFFIVIVIILIAVSLSYLYSQIVIRESENKLEEIKREFYLEENKIRVNYELSKDTYLLKIKHPIQKDQHKEIFFNGVKIDVNIFPFERQHRNFQNTYIYLPKDTVKQGGNTLEINFSHAPLSEVTILIRNYRKQLCEGAYILFSDSAYIPAGKTSSKIALFINVLILLSGIMTCLVSRKVLACKNKFLLYYQRYLLLLFFVLLLLSLAGWVSSDLGYRLVVAPNLFWKLAALALTPLFVIGAYRTLERLPIFTSEATRFWFTEKKFDTRIGIVFFLLIVVVNLWVYLPSFSHLFRHDEWFLFFASKEETPNLQLLIKHIDWQLRIPVDRLIFRPFSRSLVTLNRVIFDVNYLGPHIVTFIKHIFATFCLWWLMWQYGPRWITGLFALLFSVLVVSADSVICPHFDVYIMTTIFTILAVITFCKTIYNQLSVRKGFALTALLLFLNLLTIELGFFMPFVFFFAYWTIFRNRNDTILKQKDRCSWFVFLPPFVLWGILYSIHLYLAYPNFKMTGQSNVIGLWMPFVNTVRFVWVLLSGIFFPMFVEMRYLDKTYFRIFSIGAVLTILIIFICVRFGRKIFRSITKEAIFLFMLLLSVLIIFCFGRASYIHTTLNHFMLASGYAYCTGALIIFVIYALFDFDKILQNRKQSLLLLFILAFLIANHALKTHRTAIEIQRQTAPLKKYFDSVKEFVAVHKDEPDFSFKIIDRPPKIIVFPWYHETCIDGLFYRYVNNQNPKYLLEYDYNAEQLKYSTYTEKTQVITAMDVSKNVSKGADYINSIGICFKKVSGQEYNFFIGISEVTQKQWQDVMSYNPSRFKNDSHPVENVSFYMVQEFIKRLNEIEGSNFYRLPTEKEYLYILDLFMTNPNIQDKDISKFAWFKDNSNGITHPVGSLEPLNKDLYDLIGNVWEWTENPIDYNSTVKPFKDNPHICFGGSWRDDDTNPHELKTNYPLDFRHEHLGFRLVREIKKDRLNGAD